MIQGVPSSEVPDVWPVVSKILDPAIKRSGGRLSRASVLEGLLKREMQLWLAVDGEILGAMVTQIATHPTGLKVLVGLLVGGKDLKRWVHLWPHIEDWGRSLGCEVAEMPRGRGGWTRVFKDWNAMTFMEKKI